MSLADPARPGKMRHAQNSISSPPLQVTGTMPAAEVPGVQGGQAVSQGLGCGLGFLLAGARSPWSCPQFFILLHSASPQVAKEMCWAPLTRRLGMLLGLGQLQSQQMLFRPPGAVLQVHPPHHTPSSKIQSLTPAPSKPGPQQTCCWDAQTSGSLQFQLCLKTS